jgi:hypothetical protein
VRFYNAAQDHILDLSNVSGLWNWKTPAVAPPSILISFDDAGLVSRADGANNRTPSAVAPTTTNLSTTNPATTPEPTSAALMMVGLVSLAARRRRQAK